MPSLLVPQPLQVRYGTLGLLLGALSALETVLEDCSAAAAAAAAAAGSGVSQQQQQQQGWLALRAWLQQAARQQLPDPTLLLALLAAAEKEGWAEGAALRDAVAWALQWRFF